MEPLEGGLEHILHRVLRRIDGDLGDESHPLAGGDVDLTVVPVQFAGDDLEQGGLTGAVFAQQAHPLPLIDLEGEAVQYFFAYLELFAQVRDGDIDHCLPPNGVCDTIGWNKAPRSAGAASQGGVLYGRDPLGRKYPLLT